MKHIQYVAGFFDGEGCVTFCCAGRGYGIPRAGINNTDRRPLEEVHKMFGGGIVSVRQGGRRKDSWGWHVHGRDLERFLRSIQPHVLTKRNQVDLALEYIDWRRSDGLKPFARMSEAQKIVASQFATRLTTLNKRGS